MNDKGLPFGTRIKTEMITATTCVHHTQSPSPHRKARREVGRIRIRLEGPKPSLRICFINLRPYKSIYLHTSY